MQLDRVRRDPGLAVVEVEEGDPGNARSSAEPDVAPRHAHLTAPQRRRLPVAARRGRLRDHVVAALLEDDVQVAVVLGRTSTTRGDDREDVALERKPRVRDVRRAAGVMR